MNTVWDKGNRDKLFARIDRLTPDAKPRWGKFDSTTMLAHLADSVRMAIGELEVAPRKLILRKPVIKHFVVYLMPFPKNAPTAPELIRSAPTQFAPEQSAVKDLLMRFATESRRSFPEHAAFGPLSRTAWGVLLYRHFDHHLKQFSV